MSDGALLDANNSLWRRQLFKLSDPCSPQSSNEIVTILAFTFLRGRGKVFKICLDLVSVFSWELRLHETSSANETLITHLPYITG